MLIYVFHKIRARPALYSNHPKPFGYFAVSRSLWPLESAHQQVVVDHPAGKRH
jgi:hypothetical protein